MGTTSNQYWQNLKCSFLKHIEEIINAPGNRKGYGRSMDLLVDYCITNNHNEYFPAIGFDFIESEKAKGYKGHTTNDRRRATIRRLNEFLYGNTFWQKKPRELRHYKSSHVSLECPDQFAEEFEEFLQQLSREGLKEITVNKYRNLCVKYMLCDFAEQGVMDWESITARNLTSAFSRTVSKNVFATYARRLFGYLVSTGTVSNNYSCILPIVSKRKILPSVYSESEVKQLLDSVERFTPQGKRDYAMLLIAVRLGMRASDVSNLRFENIDFVHGVIKFVQFKTSVPHQLPLPTEVADAITDYIDNGREESCEPYIFLDGHTQPLTRQAVAHIGARHIKYSGIDIGTRHHGTHALRMTYASQLIAENMPYDVVRYALGHVDPNSTRHYVQFDTEKLRACALDVPPPSGLFKEYLEVGDNNVINSKKHSR